MKHVFVVSLLLVVFTACWDLHSLAEPDDVGSEVHSVIKEYVGNQATQKAIEAVRHELQNPHSLEFSSRIHGQSVEERRAHLNGMLEWLQQRLAESAAGSSDPRLLDAQTPRIDAAFTLVDIRKVLGPGGSYSGTAQASVLAYTAVSDSGLIAHYMDWLTGYYFDWYDIIDDWIGIPYDLAAVVYGTEFATESECLYIINESFPEMEADYYTYASTYHGYTVVELQHQEGVQTYDSKDTRYDQPDPSRLGCSNP